MAKRRKNVLGGGGKGKTILKIIVIGGVLFVAWDYFFNCSKIITPMKAIQINPKCGRARLTPLSPKPGSVEEAARRRQQQNGGASGGNGNGKAAPPPPGCGTWDIGCHLSTWWKNITSGKTIFGTPHGGLGGAGVVPRPVIIA